MGSSPVVAVLAALALSSLGDPQVDAAIQALRKDSSLKVRTQAAIVLGQRTAPEAVQALREAVAEDAASSVRIAAVAALAKIGDRRARPTLRNARSADPDEAVRRAAARALTGFGPVGFAIDDPAGPASARGPLREALARELKERGFAVSDRGELRLKPTVKLDVDEKGGKTVVAVRTSIVVVDGDGRADLMESGARASVAGSLPEHKLAAVLEKAIGAAVHALCDDLAAKLAER